MLILNLFFYFILTMLFMRLVPTIMFDANTYHYVCHLLIFHMGCASLVSSSWNSTYSFIPHTTIIRDISPNFVPKQR